MVLATEFISCSENMAKFTVSMKHVYVLKKALSLLLDQNYLYMLFENLAQTSLSER